MDDLNFHLYFGSMWFGVKVMAYSMLISSMDSQSINAWSNRKLLNYGYLKQVKDIIPQIHIAICMEVCV